MSRMTITNELPAYEVDDKEVPNCEDLMVKVTNHWNIRDFVRLEFAGKAVTVSAEDLKRAIDNATNRGL